MLVIEIYNIDVEMIDNIIDHLNIRAQMNKLIIPGQRDQPKKYDKKIKTEYKEGEQLSELRRNSQDLEDRRISSNI